MWRNYLKVAIRNMLRYKRYTFINLVGLVLGIVCATILYLYVQHELSYDNFHERKDDIYRVITKVTYHEADQMEETSYSNAPLAFTIVADIPAVETATRIRYAGQPLLAYQKKKFLQDKAYHADSTFFEIFDYSFLAGNPATALDLPKSVVLTETEAQRFFDTPEEAFGKTITVNEEPFVVRGVIEDVPDNAHLQFQVLFSMNSLSPQRLEQLNVKDWAALNFKTYVLLKEGASQKTLNDDFRRIIRKYAQKDLDVYSEEHTYSLQPLRDIRLYSNFAFDDEVGTIQYVRIFSFAAIFILLVAAINYVNLATARATTRAKEVGLRKVVGGNRKQLVQQFVAESVVLIFIASVLALLLVTFSLPFLSDFIGKDFSYTYLFTPTTLLGLLGILLSLTLLSSFYPAWVLSGFEPVKVLKGQLLGSLKGQKLYQVLVVVQFAVASFMILGTWVVQKQLEYISKKDVGYERAQLVGIPIYYPQISEKVDVLKQQLSLSSHIEAYCTTHLAPAFASHWAQNPFRAEQEEGSFRIIDAEEAPVDYDYIDLLQIEIKQGRNFSKAYKTDVEEAVIVNETFVEKMGWDNPIGKRMIRVHHYERGDTLKQRVVGVVKDFHPKSLHQAVKPMVLRVVEQGYMLIAKLKKDQQVQALRDLKASYEALEKTYPFDIYFMDKEFEAQYKADAQRGSVFLAFAVITIFIAVLGLFGLSTFTVSKRIKEIGIRKILGASVWQIVQLLTQNYLRLVLLSFLIAMPLAYYFMTQWLENFAYQTTIGWSIFIYTATIVITVILSTVAYQTLTAARSNPAASLKYE